MHLCLILLNEGVFRRRLGDGAGCGARAQVSHTWTREAFGAPLGRHYECPARSWLTSGRKWPRREAWPEDRNRRGGAPRGAPVMDRRSPWNRRSARPRGGPRGAAIRTSAVSALRPPRLFAGGSSQSSGRKRARENTVGCLKSHPALRSHLAQRPQHALGRDRHGGNRRGAERTQRIVDGVHHGGGRAGG